MLRHSSRGLARTVRLSRQHGLRPVLQACSYTDVNRRMDAAYLGTQQPCNYIGYGTRTTVTKQSRCRLDAAVIWMPSLSPPTGAGHIPATTTSQSRHVKAATRLCFPPHLALELATSSSTFPLIPLCACVCALVPGPPSNGPGANRCLPQACSALYEHPLQGLVPLSVAVHSGLARCSTLHVTGNEALYGRVLQRTAAHYSAYFS